LFPSNPFVSRQLSVAGFSLPESPIYNQPSKNLLTSLVPIYR
jgi:hypothetical protein